MKSFWELSQQIREDAMPMGPPGGAPPMGGGLPPGGPMGGGMPPMGGGMPPMGGPPGLGGPPMGGGAPGTSGPAKQIRPSSVWEILEKIVDGKAVDKLKKSGGQSNPGMLQGAAQQPSQLPAPPAPEQGMAPSGPPAQPPPMPMM